MFYYTEYDSPIGKITIASNGSELVGLWLEGQKHFMDTLPEVPVYQAESDLFKRISDWLDRYFAGKKPDICELPLSPIGGEFRCRVWRYLCEIPYGEVTTYGAIAKRIAADLGKEKMSAQAVGGAVGHNPISIIIPCHRVVGANGNITGYDGGIEKKIQLLTLEGVDTSKLISIE